MTQFLIEAVVLSGIGGIIGLLLGGRAGFAGVGDLEYAFLVYLVVSRGGRSLFGGHRDYIWSVASQQSGQARSHRALALRINLD